MFFAEPDRVENAGIDAERIDQGIADGLGAALAEFEIVFAAADCIGVADHEKAVAQQNRIVQSVGDRADSAIGFRPNGRGVEVEVHLDGELRELFQFGKTQRMRGGRGGLPGIVADIVQSSLAHRSSGECDPAAAHALQAFGNVGRVQSRLRHGGAQRHHQRGGAEKEDLLRFHC